MNTRRMNRLEELGRVDAEKAFTKKGARNLKDEKKRIVRELKADGGRAKMPMKKIKDIPGPQFTKQPKRKGPTPKQQKRLGAGAQGSKKRSGKMAITVGGKIISAERVGKKMGGSLKPVQPNQKGLKKLPTKVRNKMGYMKKGGRVGMGKALRGGGCVR